MSKRFVFQVGEPVLREICKPVKRFDGALWELLNDMKETVRAEYGAGLAAPQIGVNLRVVVIDVEEGFFELINPVILSQKRRAGRTGGLPFRKRQAGHCYTPLQSQSGILRPFRQKTQVNGGRVFCPRRLPRT